MTPAEDLAGSVRRIDDVRRGLGERLSDVNSRHFQGDRQERMFLASVSFFAAFAAARGVTHAIRHNLGPFHNFSTRGGTHIDHAVFGIAGLLGVGYAWNAQLGLGANHARGSRVSSLVFGAPRIRATARRLP